MLSTAVLWQSIYYVRFSWYLSIDTDYDHNLTPDVGACSSDHPVLGYRVIMMSMIDYIQTHEPILESKLALVVHQVMETHCSMDCFDHVAKHLRMALDREKKCTKARCNQSDYSELPPFSLSKDKDFNDLMSSLWGDNRCMACEEPDKLFILRSMNNDAIALLGCEWSLMSLGGGDNKNFDMIVCHERDARTGELEAMFGCMYSEMEAGR
jgi:hypothetical protein